MGTKSKHPVKIESYGGGTEVPPRDGLPAFSRFIDIHGVKRGEKALTRLFLASPTSEDVADTVKLKESRPELVVVAANVQSFRSPKPNPALFDHCRILGFADDFATDLVRLVINHLRGKHLGMSTLIKTVGALQEFVKFLAAHRQKPSTLTDIDKYIWLAFLETMEADQLKSTKTIFNYSRALFAAYGPTSHGGWLARIPFRNRRRAKPSSEHTSELAESKDYSDVVMHQLLSLFIYEFERRIGYLKRYKQSSEADMPEDWSIRRGRPAKVAEGGVNKGQLVRQWLQDEDAGYEVIIDRYLMHHSAGLIRRNRFGTLHGGIATTLQGLRATGETALVSKFQVEMARRHGYDAAKGGVGLINFYIKKKSPTEANSVINQIGWCLANLVMMQTGVNKEVVLTIPSKAEDGRSILARGDNIFVKKDGTQTEAHLFGTKARTGNKSRLKVIPVIIVKNSPLYEMLVDYEKHVKVGDGSFFEFSKRFIEHWSTASQSSNNLFEIYPVTDESGQRLSSIDTRKFRKVFASGQLLDRMKNIKDMNELAETLQDDLKHGNLDITLTNYLMKSTVGRSVIDIAIATITGGKLNDLKCKSQIEGQKPIYFKKKVFLCHCTDPQNPSHDVAIADECRHYDLCLGCEQSIITKEHLPYICLRIIQYEAEREKDPYIWPALYEDKWCIAHDALARYIEKNKRNGRHLVDEAWITARQGRITLPPIIAPNRM